MEPIPPQKGRATPRSGRLGCRERPCAHVLLRTHNVACGFAGFVYSTTSLHQAHLVQRGCHVNVRSNVVLPLVEAATDG